MRLPAVPIARVRLAGRYVGVSVINFTGHQIVLYVANSIWGWPGGAANVFAALVMTMPAYLLSRTYVWVVDGGHSVRRHVMPFWIITIAGLVVSTALAALADALFGAGLLVNLGSIVGYFIVWVAKFFLLDRVFSPATTDHGEVVV